MAKIFDIQDWLKNHPNRNNFDLSHKVHGSYKMGVLYPVLCKPVVPTDSFHINTEVSLRFTPMPFPTQSNMRVIFHYFYVRIKNIWKNFPNWLEGLEEHTPPYIYQTRAFYRNSSLADYMDVPTSYNIGEVSSNIESILRLGTRNVSVENTLSSTLPMLFNANETTQVVDPTLYIGSACSFKNYNYGQHDANRLFMYEFVNLDEEEHMVSNPLSLVDVGRLKFDYDIILTGYNIGSAESHVYLLGFDPNNVLHKVFDYGAYQFTRGGIFDSDVSTSVSDSYDGSLYYYLAIRYAITNDHEPTVSTPMSGAFNTITNLVLESVLPAQHAEISDASVVNPYFGSDNSSANSIKVSALPFRAYESIYNAFYRNSQGVQPFKVDGVTKYNQYNTTTDDGADTTLYTLQRRNWELDAYTSCLISPQQGNVPYVGITNVSALGRMSVETPDGNTAEVRLSDNGDGVEISNLHGETQEARAYALRAASSGFTIPEFREANALQRFLEMNIRKGYKYIDFIEGHFGKKPEYRELDMPEFIGGFSQRIQVNEISNTNGVDTDTLGAIAGQARAIGRSKNGINHYFDDFGFVVGIMCIVPDNAYDSILPKHYNISSPLDFYFPEFSQLSYQPLTHEELAPIQTVNDPRGSAYRDLTKVFGYQRPNHELVWSPDTVHGRFRDATGIGNSVICRRFGTRPELSDAFLTIKSEETDTIFNYTFGDEDICLGEIAFDFQAKRPVPRLVVPQIS